MTSQWQVLPSPSTLLAKPSSPLLLPSIIINEENNAMDGMMVENLKQRIHDLEIEVRKNFRESRLHLELNAFDL